MKFWGPQNAFLYETVDFLLKMRIPFHLVSLSARCFSILALSTFVACSHPAPGGISHSGGAGGAVEPPITFEMADLEGDWYGQLVPNSVVFDVRNFYFRVVGGELIETADSLGNQWTSIDTSSLEFTVAGVLTANLASVLVTNNLAFTAQMDDSMTILTGEFSHLDAAATLVEGSFELKRSIGSGQFQTASLEGSWAGQGTNGQGKKRWIDMALDAAGAVLSGQMIRPFDSLVQHTYSAGTGNVFTLSNDSVGRLDNVQITADDGAILFFTYALIDEEGTLLGGPGFDTLMGSGVAVLSKTVAPSVE